MMGLTTLLPLATGAQQAERPTAAAVKAPRLNFRETRLPNGLKVVTLEDHRAPVVTVEVWYHVGSKDEAPGKAGFAHMFEHLMFKGSGHMDPDSWDRYIQPIGGNDNADTYYDRTRFYETVPSYALDRILWMEADRMTSLRIDQPNMVSERAVVEEEHRMDVENAPYGQLQEKLGPMLFPAGSPYAHTPIGIMSDLDHASLADVQAFHAEYYRPDDATLVVVGDFKTSDALAQIRKVFGPVPKSTHPFTRYPMPTITQTAETRAVLTDKLAPLPLVVVAFRLPPTASPDTPVFDVISYILSTGNSSRLYRALVRDQQIATQVDGSPQDLLMGGIFYFDALANAGKKPEEVERALTTQIDLLRSQPVSAAELEKAKSQALTAKVFGSISTEQKASALGEADLLYGTPEAVNREQAKIAAVTAADVQRVARKYFAPEVRNVLTIVPAPPPSDGGTPSNAPTAGGAR